MAYASTKKERNTCYINARRRTPHGVHLASAGYNLAACFWLVCLVYWLTRENLPVFNPFSRHKLLAKPQTPALAYRQGIVQKIVNTLPSFFHCYALIAATAALNLRQQTFLIWGVGFSSALCLAMEFVQHSYFETWLAQYGVIDENFLLKFVADYGAKGTFDQLDIAAIVTATLLAIGQFHRKKKTTDYFGDK